jgi:hypothetical protein
LNYIEYTSGEQSSVIRERTATTLGWG